MLWDLRPGRTLAVQNSVLGTIWISPSGEGNRRLELNRCAVWPAGDPLDRPLLVHTEGNRGQITVEARGTLFGGACLVSGDSGGVTAWKGDRSVYRIGLRPWLPPGDVPVFSLDDLRQRFNTPETGSVSAESYLDDPRQWQVTGPAEALGFGADVNKVARPLPGEKK